MYQPMVSGVAPEFSTMPLTSGANKWASRIVIILQLAAWSAVGIVLLQKGVTSLQKIPESRNFSEKHLTRPGQSLRQYESNEHQDLSVLSLKEQEVRARVNEIFPTLDNKTPMNLKKIKERILSDSRKHSVEFPLSNERVQREEENTTEEIPEYENKKTLVVEKLGLMKNKIPSIIKEEESRTGSKVGQITHEKLSDTKHVFHHLEDDLFYNSMKNISTDNTTNVPETLWERKKRLQSSQLSGGGAAAAVAMVAVGSVMLILGPAVIILRALDERRQARRFLKLSGRDDLPPTYEQATLMDEAPRYSTLSLNTILGPPPPPPPSPSPTSTTAQFV